MIRVLSDVVVKHTRPVGQFLKGRSKNLGYDTDAEMQRLMQRHGITAPFFGNKCYAGVLKNRSTISGSLSTRLHMIKDYALATRQRVQPFPLSHYLALLVLPEAPLSILSQIFSAKV